MPVSEMCPVWQERILPAPQTLFLSVLVVDTVLAHCPTFALAPTAESHSMLGTLPLATVCKGGRRWLWIFSQIRKTFPPLLMPVTLSVTAQSLLRSSKLQHR